jgi:hypothetical protein
MKVLLDECVPWPMHKLLTGHDCVSTQWRGWGGIKNGDLIRLAGGIRPFHHLRSEPPLPAESFRALHRYP